MPTVYSPVHVRNELLRGREITDKIDFDPGEIDIRCQWSDRKYDDDDFASEKAKITGCGCAASV